VREICWHSRVKQPICEDAHADGDSYEKRKPYRGAILNGLRIAAFCPLRSVQLLRCHCEFPPSPEGNARDCSVVPLRHFVEITPALLALPDSLHTLGRAEAQRALISVPASRASARISIMGGSASAASSQQNQEDWCPIWWSIPTRGGLALRTTRSVSCVRILALFFTLNGVGRR
jgi:hypothetical protein